MMITGSTGVLNRSVVDFKIFDWLNLNVASFSFYTKNAINNSQDIDEDEEVDKEGGNDDDDDKCST